MPTDDYTSTPSTGRLKLKGVSDNRIDKKKKKKKRSKPDTNTADIHAEDIQDRSVVLKSLEDEDREITEAADRGTSVVDGEKVQLGSGENVEDIKRGLRTESERRFEEQRRKRLEERLKRDGVKTHKQRVEELNKYLSGLSEHHDMPKIGPG